MIEYQTKTWELTCSTCRFWDSPTASRYGECTRIVEGAEKDLDLAFLEQVGEAQTLFLMTRDDFSCILWE